MVATIRMFTDIGSISDWCEDAPEPGAIDACGLDQFFGQSSVEIAEQQRHDRQAEHNMHRDDAWQRAVNTGIVLNVFTNGYRIT